MIKRLFSLLIFGCLFFPAIIEADVNFDSIRNPFTSQLPEIKVEKPVEPKKDVRASRRSERNQRPEQPTKQTPEPVKPEIAETPTLQVSGLVWNSNRPQAIINGQVVGIGDTIQEVDIVGIRKDEIDIEFQGRALTIKL